MPSDQHPSRGTWANPCEFLLSCIGFAVGLGNVWRFPYLCYRNGGGAFLIPYAIMLFTTGLPLFFVELAIGQYASLGPNKIFQKMAPVFHGVGYACVWVIFIVSLYYNVIVAWTLFYTFASFSSELGWARCDHEWNTDYCYSEEQKNECIANLNGTTENPVTYFNRSCHYVEDLCNSKGLAMINASYCGSPFGTQKPMALKTLLSRILASEDYFNQYMLGIGNSTWEKWGGIRWQMVLCLLLAWILVALCIIKGVQSSGKVVYFTAVFPYVVLVALLVRGATLEGAYDGILFYITPKWETLKDAKVWGDAASQIFYSLGLACGSLITLSSYSKFNNNCHRDALIVSMANCCTSVFAGFVIFSILGFMALQLGVPVDEVVKSGPGLAFIAYPEAVLRMPFPQLWAILFFLMLFTLGLDSQFAGVETITTAIMDQWPKLRERKPTVVIVTCTVCFILGLTMCFDGGVYMFTLLDWNSAYWSILLIGLVEIGLVSWVYGYRRFMKNIDEMGIWIPFFMKVYWASTLIVLCPLMLLGILIFTFYNFVPAYYGTYAFPYWVDVLGWLIGASSVILIPAFAVYRIWKDHSRGLDLLRPTLAWGPESSRQEHISPTFPRVESMGQTYENKAFDGDVITRY